MSFVNKLEKSYLDLLRVVVLVIASLLLLAVIVLCGMGAYGVLAKSEVVVKSEKVRAEDVIKDITPAADASTVAATDGKTKAVNDPLKPYYDKIAVTIESFVKAYSGGTEQADKVKVAEYLSSKAHEYSDEDVRLEYITGLQVTMDAALKSNVTIARVKKSPQKALPAVPPAQAFDENGAPVELAAVDQEQPFNESPLKIAGEVINSYTAHFDKLINDARNEKRLREAENMEKKTTAVSMLYIALGLFGVFLFVIFMSILVKIERNLRIIADKSELIL